MIRDRLQVPGGHISTLIILRDTGSQENGRKVLCHDTLGSGVTGSGVSAAVMENGCCSYNFTVMHSLSRFLRGKCIQQ